MAALELQRKLEAIRDGEPPYDIYVRWKPLHEQPIGWQPDLNDGVRLNIRPFVDGRRAAQQVHDQLEQGSRHEPGRQRAAERPSSDQRAEARGAREARQLAVND